MIISNSAQFPGLSMSTSHLPITIADPSPMESEDMSELVGELPLEVGEVFELGGDELDPVEDRCDPLHCESRVQHHQHLHHLPDIPKHVRRLPGELWKVNHKSEQ